MKPATAAVSPVHESIHRRRSCRSFEGRPLEAQVLEGLERTAAGVEAPFGSRPRFGIIDNEKVRAENLFSAGSYGMIKGSRYYLAALVRRDEPRRWEDAGFALEAAVLHAAGLGLGTCWIGGVFDRKRFGRVLGIRPDEQLPAVVAVGRPTEKRAWRDRLVRWSAKGDRRTPAADLFFTGGWDSPAVMENAGEWKQVFECVRLAPSASNKQPWRIVRIGSAFHFFLARDRAYSAMMPLADLQRIDLGIAMCHFQFSAAEIGLQGKWRDSMPQIEGTPGHFEYIATYVIRDS